MWGNQAAHGSASTDLAPAFSRIPLLELPRSVPSRVRVRTCSMRCAPQFLALPVSRSPFGMRLRGNRAKVNRKMRASSTTNNQPVKGLHNSGLSEVAKPLRDTLRSIAAIRQPLISPGTDPGARGQNLPLYRSGSASLQIAPFPDALESSILIIHLERHPTAYGR